MQSLSGRDWGLKLAGPLAPRYGGRLQVRLLRASKVYGCPQGLAHRALTVPEYFFVWTQCIMQTTVANKSNYVSGNFQSDCFHSILKYPLKNDTRNAMDTAVVNIHT